MSSYAGFDRLTYPGDKAMQFLWDNTDLYWTGFYLAPAPSQRYTGWMNKRKTLADMGWGFAPIYVGQQSEGPGSKILTSAQGTIDAADAARLAQQAQFPSRSVIYLDVEQYSSPVQQPTKDYYQAWVQGVFDKGYYPGAYCKHKLAPQLDSVDLRPVIWVYHVKYSHKTFDLRRISAEPAMPMHRCGSSRRAATSAPKATRASRIPFTTTT